MSLILMHLVKFIEMYMWGLLNHFVFLRQIRYEEAEVRKKLEEREKQEERRKREEKQEKDVGRTVSKGPADSTKDNTKVLPAYLPAFVMLLDMFY